MSKPNSFRPFDWVWWYALAYRTLMRVSHHYGWHYTGKPLGPFEDCSTQLWCRWCGMRETTPRKTLPLQATGAAFFVVYSYERMGWCVYKRISALESTFVSGPYATVTEADNDLPCFDTSQEGKP